MIGLLIGVQACGGQTDAVEITESRSPPKTSEHNATVQVFRSKGAIQCESKGDSLATTAKLLKDAGIEVIKSHCGYTTGMMMAAMCGNPTFDINVHTIKHQDLALSEKNGFFPVKVLVNEEKGLGFELRELCVDNSEASE